MGWGKYLIDKNNKVLFEVSRHSKDNIAELEYDEIGDFYEFIEYFSDTEFCDFEISVIKYLYKKADIPTSFDIPVITLKGLYGRMEEITDNHPDFEEYVKQGYKVININYDI